MGYKNSLLKSNSKLLITLFLSLCAFGINTTNAAPRKLTVVGGEEAVQSIAITAFEWMGSGRGPSVDIATVITTDIARSGLFDPIPQSDFASSPTFGGPIRFAEWRTLGADYLVIGRMIPHGKGGFILEFELFDIYNGDTLIGYKVTVRDKTLLRNASHHIADLIYEELLGRKGAFNTKIAYVSVSESNSKKIKYQLIISDSDGMNKQAIVTSSDPIMSPVWSPSGDKISYVSFEKRKTQIYVQDIETQKRKRIISFRGINGSPSWSPKGDKIAFVLSKDGDPEIYIKNIENDDMIRLTHSRGIDTEPVWTPDGRNIVFTSDRGGNPQLYQVSSNGGKAKRLTFNGSYNSDASFSADGNFITFVHRGDDKKYKIALINLHNDTMKVLTDGPLDESPSFSPNGDMIVYASKRMNRMVLKSVSRNGSAIKPVSLDGNLSQPNWAPF